MTDADWLTCTDPSIMLEFLNRRISERKLVLFACACCRNVWDLLPDDRSRKAIELAEQAVDEELPQEVLAVAIRNAREASSVASGPNRIVQTEAVRLLFCHPLHNRALARVVANRIREALPQEAPRQASILRDLFGSVLHRPIVVPCSWLEWHDGTVVQIARAIYDDRAFDRLPILADALLDAGCTNEAILEHCRSPGPHVRGCWVVDLLLNKS